MIYRLFLLSFLGILITACDNKTQDAASKEVASQKAVSQKFSQPYSKMLVFPKKNPIQAFKLVNHDNQNFTESNFNQSWNFIFMGFTHCPDVCPTTLADLKNIYQEIPAELQKNMRVIFLSVDPKRDEVSYMKKYISAFHDDFIGITGDKSEIDKLVADLGGIYVINNEDEEYYTVDHTAKIFIVSPKGERYGIISSEAMHDKDKSVLIDEIQTLVKDIKL